MAFLVSTAAPRVAHLMAIELHRDEVWEAEQLAAFRQTAAKYVV